MSAAQHTPAPWWHKTVEMDGRNYTVYFGDGTNVSRVQVHARNKAAGYCIAFRRLPLTSAKAQAAISLAKAQEAAS